MNKELSTRLEVVAALYSSSYSLQFLASKSHHRRLKVAVVDTVCRQWALA